MSDADDQHDELMALASIYDESVFSSHTDSEGLSTGILRVSVDISQPFYVTLPGKGKLNSVIEFAYKKRMSNLPYLRP